MMIGPAPMIRMDWMSVRFGMWKGNPENVRAFLHDRPADRVVLVPMMNEGEVVAYRVE